jgi:hypothetical protein
MELRHQIRQFRNAVGDRVEQLMRDEPHLELYIRHALGIPRSFPLLPKRWAAWRHIIQFFVPVWFSASRAGSLLRKIRTYEGREYFFSSSLSRTFSLLSPWLNPPLDYALRHLDPPRTVEAFKDLQMLDEHWLKAVHGLGMTTIAEVMPFARSNVHRLHGELALMLIQEGVITCIEELSWTAYEPDSSAGRSVEDPCPHPTTWRMGGASRSRRA